jgi:hypothetical protein
MTIKALLPTVSIAALFLMTASYLCAQAEPPAPPPPVSGSSGSVSGSISQLNYGPEMEVTSFLVNGNTLVTFPPHVGAALSATLRAGENVQINGYSSSTASGMQRMELTRITADGKTFSIPQPGQFTTYNGSGKVAQLNYNREGEVDGFLLDNGVFVTMPPPVAASLGSSVSVGSQLSITGNSHRTMTGRTVVDLQSLNGQTVANAPPPRPTPSQP